MMVRYTNEASGGLTLDDTHFPIVIMTWRGPASAALLAMFEEFVGEQLDRAADQGCRLVCLHDCLLAEGPTKHLRRPVVELGARLKPRIERGRMLTIMVLDQVVIRTLMSAVVVINRAAERIRVCPDLRRGIDLALQIVEEGMARPAALHPDAYRAPGLATASA